MNKLNSSQSKKISLESLEYLEQILLPSKNGKQSLQNRKVMVPITTKAFFEGKLQPSIRKSRPAQKAEEEILINLGQGYLAAMTSEEASSYIERRMKALRPQTTVTNKENKKKKFQMKKGFLNSKKSKLKPALKKSSTKPELKADDASLPMMEIREELDRDGNEVKSEATDLSEQLTHVRQELGSKKDLAGPKHGIVDTLLDSVPKSTALNVGMNTDQASSTETDVMAEEEIEDEADTKGRSYEEISARLDELILLEENEEKNKALNVKSSKQIQGKGWSKGFLSNNSKVAKKKSSKKTAKKSSEPTLAEDSNATKKVQFRQANEVKEIPRIGTRSINAVKAFPVSPHSLPQDSMAGTVMQQPTPKQNRSTKSVSIGGIVERGNAKSIDNSSRNGTDHNTATEQPKKKLSRFAQRRLEQRT